MEAKGTRATISTVPNMEMRGSHAQGDAEGPTVLFPVLERSLADTVGWR